MTRPAVDVARKVAESVDRDGRVSVREVASKIFIRFRLFLACVILVPAVAILVTYLVPGKYKVTAKVLIRRDRSESSFLGEITTPERQVVSGRSNAEIIQSIPVCLEVVKTVKLESKDVAKSMYKVLLGYLAPLIRPFLPASETSGPEAEQASLTNLAKEFRDTIEVKTIQPERTVVEVNDELIQVIVPSPTREKIAAMANQVCEAFIDEYYRLSEADANRAYAYLSKQAEVLEADLTALQAGAAGDLAGSPEGSPPLGEGADKTISLNPFVDQSSKEIAQMELELARLQQIYKEDAPELVQLRERLERSRAVLRRQETLETAKAVVNLVKSKRRQAYMTAQLYRNRLVPISIVEAAVTPKASILKEIGRYAMNGGIGLGSGLVLGIALVLLLGTLDHRLYTTWDVEKGSAVPVVGSLPVLPSERLREAALNEYPLSEATAGLTRVLGKIGLFDGLKGQVLLITSPTQGEGKTAVALQMAAALAADKRAKVLLVDGNFVNPELSNLLEQSEADGLVEVLGQSKPVAEVIRPTVLENLKFIPAGKTGARLTLGFFRKSLHDALAVVRGEYDVVMIDGPGVLAAGESAILASEADRVLLVVKAGATRLEPLAAAVTILEEVDAHPFGAIMNFRRFPIPRTFYRKM
ncbi:MAG: AAA family ATPase [Phycisphaerae bacterium]|nr:AAA family ATPase [Phycisphaerae bacterium]